MQELTDMTFSQIGPRFGEKQKSDQTNPFVNNRLTKECLAVYEKCYQLLKGSQTAANANYKRLAIQGYLFTCVTVFTIKSGQEFNIDLSINCEKEKSDNLRV